MAVRHGACLSIGVTGRHLPAPSRRSKRARGMRQDPSQPLETPRRRPRRYQSIAVQMIAATALLLAIVLAVFLVITRVQLRRLADEQGEARGTAVEDATRKAGESISRT